MKLDEKGRCCGRKPIKYKGGSWRSPLYPMYFCTRCDRAYSVDSLKQIENWAWKRTEDGEFINTVARFFGGEIAAHIHIKGGE